jgi:hypothetical protein
VFPVARVPQCTGYARVAAVAGAFATAFSAPERALALYLAAFVCDELVRLSACVVWWGA